MTRPTDADLARRQAMAEIQGRLEGISSSVESLGTVDPGFLVAELRKSANQLGKIANQDRYTVDRVTEGQGEGGDLQHERNFWRWKHDRRVEEILQLREELPKDSPNYLEPRICTGCLLGVDELEDGDTLAPVEDKNGEQIFACGSCRVDLADLFVSPQQQPVREEGAGADLAEVRRELRQHARDAEAEERRRISHGMNGAGPHSAMRAYDKAADLLDALDQPDHQPPDQGQERDGLEEARSTLATIRSWCDDPPAGHRDAGGYLLAAMLADLIDTAVPDVRARLGFPPAPTQPAVDLEGLREQLEGLTRYRLTKLGSQRNPLPDLQGGWVRRSQVLALLSDSKEKDKPGGDDGEADRG